MGQELIDIMAMLIWKHGKTREEARRLIRARMTAAGINDVVKWHGDSFKASIGWGAVLNLVGEINDESIELSKVSGAMAGVVLAKSREAFETLFPGGEQLETIDATQQKSIV